MKFSGNKEEFQREPSVGMPFEDTHITKRKMLCGGEVPHHQWLDDPILSVCAWNS